MKNLDLNKYGVQEMNAKEMKTTEGGNPVTMFLALAAFIFGITYPWGE
jgi:hypothetical protein